MDGVVIFQISILSSMRNQALRDEALAQVTATAPYIAEVEHQITEAGLFLPDATIEKYEKVLGPPVNSLNVNLGQFEKSKNIYSLPLFRMPLAIYFGENGHVGQIKFERLSSDKSGSLTIDAFRPWHAVEDDIYKSFQDYRTADDWFPMKDLVVRTEGREYIFQFDFGLFQNFFSDMNIERTTIDSSESARRDEGVS